MGRWGDMAKSAKSSGDGKYVKLEDGMSISFAVTDADVGIERTWWAGGQKVSSDTKGAELAEKVVLCVYDLEAEQCRILRLGTGTFARLSAKLDKFGEGCGYSVTRLGTGMKTKYEVDKLDKLTPEQVEAIARAETYEVLDEKDVEPLQVESEPEPAPPAAPSRAPKGKPPAKAAESAVDDDIPF